MSTITREKRLEEIDQELTRLDAEPARYQASTGDYDEVSVNARSTRWGELEGEKRGLEAIAA
jgi:hypothetical protein